MQIMYHATSQSNWQAIQAEGVLWGVRYAPSRYTYLATNFADTLRYGDVYLKVYFDPDEYEHHNWVEGCWQCRVYDPIPLKRVCRIMPAVSSRERDDRNLDTLNCYRCGRLGCVSWSATGGPRCYLHSSYVPVSAELRRLSEIKIDLDWCKSKLASEDLAVESKSSLQELIRFLQSKIDI